MCLRVHWLNEVEESRSMTSCNYALGRAIHERERRLPVTCAVEYLHTRPSYTTQLLLSSSVCTAT